MHVISFATWWPSLLLITTHFDLYRPILLITTHYDSYRPILLITMHFDSYRPVSDCDALRLA